MTNEEAKRHIMCLLERGGSDGFDYKEEEALDLAIKALEATDTNVVSMDCISRQEVLELIDYVEYDNFDEYVDLEQKIKDLPSVIPSTDLEGYSDRLWRNAYERGKADAIAEMENAHE